MRFALIFLLTLNTTFANDYKAEVEALVNNAISNAKDYEAKGRQISYPKSSIPSFNSNSNESNVLVFVSFSMPQNMLLEYIEEAKRYNATLVLRGVVRDANGKLSIPATTKKLMEISNKTGVNFIIHPKLFNVFSVSRVPVIVKVNGDFECITNGGECDFQPQFDKITGSVSIKHALESFDEGRTVIKNKN